ncbi:MAG: TIGR03084 family protein [Deltaproteobacteria bacterium]|nr:TIGR03084 family protein [Deltaproteobacteria bacterium]
MKALCADLSAEYSQLAIVVETLTPEQWGQKTPFSDWTPWDEIAHLCYFDETGMLAATDPEAFAAETAALLKQYEKGIEIDAVARERYGHLDGPRIMPHWRAKCERLIGVLSAMDPKARLPWYGPMLSVRSFATSRLMEIWAHGRDIFSCAGERQPVSDRLKNVAHLGVNTYRWSFMNRNLPVPEPAPYIELQAPSGEKWIWNGPASEDHALRGSAEEFCLVVTRRQHVADTRLQFAGNAAKWLPIAQCFAGPPEEAPPPCSRRG